MAEQTISIEQELVEATGVTPRKRENRPNFLARLVSKAQELSDDDWMKLSDEAQDYVNDAQTAINTKAELPEPDPAPAPTAAAEASGDDEDDLDEDEDEDAEEDEDEDLEDDEDEDDLDDEDEEAEPQASVETEEVVEPETRTVSRRDRIPKAEPEKPATGRVRPSKAKPESKPKATAKAKETPVAQPPVRAKPGPKAGKRGGKKVKKYVGLPEGRVRETTRGAADAYRELVVRNRDWDRDRAYNELVKKGHTLHYMRQYTIFSEAHKVMDLLG